MRKYSIQTGKPTFSCPCESLCAIFRPKLRQLPIMECLSLVEEMWKTCFLRILLKLAGTKIVQVKELMLLFSGISQKTLTGKAVEGKMVWHNFFYCLRICYAWRHFYRACPVTEKRDSITHGSYRTPPIMCFCLDIKGHFIPLVPLLRAIVTWSFGERQEKCYNFIT